MKGHVLGQSEFVDDRVALPNEVYVGVVYSPYAHARVVSVDPRKALELPGVLAVFTAHDIPHNVWGTIFQDQPLMAMDEVNFAGEVVALVVVTDRHVLKEAKKRVCVQYEILPAIKTIREAIAQKSFIAGERQICRGEIERAFRESDHQLRGSLKIQGAEHFYLENQVAIAYPLEDGQIEVHSSSQHPSEVQHVVAHALGLDLSRVVCIVKRLGGGFGGKESQAAWFAAFPALVAMKLQRPARLVLTKEEDMMISGKRNPFEIDYEVGFFSNGKIHALNVRLYSDAGAYADLSTSIMERAMLHCDNAYFLPNCDIRGQVCKTHHHPHTAFRGFGGPKGVAMIEQVIEKMARHLGMDALDVRRINLYGIRESNVTPYGQYFRNNCLPKIFETLEKDSNYRERRNVILENNRQVRHHGKGFLKGLSLTPVKFGISFTTRFLNQGNALVIVHRDGSLQVSTGAVEMGQGVNARIQTCVASELGLEDKQVRMMPTRTDKNANTSPTAASSGTDLNAAAALIATQKIKARLSSVASQILEFDPSLWARSTAGIGTQRELELAHEDHLSLDVPLKESVFHGMIFSDGKVYHQARPEKSVLFSDLVNEAYLNRVSLSDYGFYKIPGIRFDKLKGHGEPFFYFTQGAAVSEVHVDYISGKSRLADVHILMDLGRPILKDLDVGQVTGAFVQGLGWVTSENLFYSKDGLLLSHAPSTYKIPGISDIPEHFKVDLIHNPGNDINVRGTKAVGEPPLLLALSAWTALQDALSADLPIPATQEVLLRSLAPEDFKKFEGKAL